MIGSCFACPVGSPDSSSKPDVDSPGFGNSDSWKCFSSASHFFRFSPLISPDESHHSSDPLRLPTQWDPSAKKAPTQLSALLEFHFLTILLIPKRKSLPQTKNMSWYLKMNVTTAHNYITLGKVRKLGQRLPLLLNKITVFFRLLYTLELCVFVPLGAVEIVFVACKKNDFNLEWLCGLILFTERAGIFRRTISTGEQSLQNTAETSESGRLHGNYLFSKYLLCIWPKNIWIYKNFINTMYF